MESYELEGGRFVMKSIEIENRGGAWIDNG